MLDRLTGVRKSQRGDTIIEVLISVTVVAVVLASAYAITNRSLAQGIEAKERTEALAYLQGQVEALKYRELKSSATVFQNLGFGNTANNHYCLDGSAADPSSTDYNSSKWGIQANPFNRKNTTTNQVEIDNQDNYVPICRKGGDKYFLDITVDKPDNSVIPPEVYTFTVYWSHLGDGPPNQEQLYYRF